MMRMVRAGGWALFAFAARSTQQLSALIIMLLAARFLPPEQYGVYSLAIVFLVLAQTMTYTGLYQFILSAREDDAVLLPTCFWLMTGLCALASLALIGAAMPLEWLLRARPLGHALILLALAQPLAGAAAWASAVLLRRGRINLNFAIMLVQNLVALAGGVLLLRHWHTIYALVAFRYLRVLAGLVLYATLAPDRPTLRFNPGLARKAMRYSGGLYASRMLDFLARYAADLLLGLLHSPAAVGLYRFGSRMATGAGDIINQPMASFAATQFAAAARRGEDLSPALARFAGTVTLLAGIVGAVVIVFAGDAIALLFHPTYMPALAVAQVMALRGMAGGGRLLLEPAFAALGRTGWVMLFDLASATICIAALIVASPFGLAALAWAQVLAVAAASTLALRLLARHGDLAIGIALRPIGGAAALSAVYGAMLLLVRCTIGPATALSTLAPQLALAALLALGVVAVAQRIGVFSLRVFAG